MCIRDRYNILELKFIRGYRVRDVALRLAMSESDLYRKQRVAIEEVARMLAEMERQEHAELQPMNNTQGPAPQDLFDNDLVAPYNPTGPTPFRAKREV